MNTDKQILSLHLFSLLGSMTTPAFLLTFCYMNIANGNVTGNHFVTDWHVLLEVPGIGMGGRRKVET